MYGRKHEVTTPVKNWGVDAGVLRLMTRRVTCLEFHPTRVGCSLFFANQLPRHFYSVLPVCLIRLHYWGWSQSIPPTATASQYWFEQAFAGKQASNQRRIKIYYQCFMVKQAIIFDGSTCHHSTWTCFEILQDFAADEDRNLKQIQ